MYIVFFFLYSAPPNVDGSSNEISTTNERETVVLFFNSFQVGNWLYIITYNMTTAVILWQILL